MKHLVTPLVALTLTGCGPMMYVGRLAPVPDYPESTCVIATVESMDGVSAVTHSRLTGDALNQALYHDDGISEDATVVHEYRYIYKGVENSFQFAEDAYDDIYYAHQYRSDRSDWPISETDDLVSFMMDLEEQLSDSCGIDLDPGGSTRVCARLFGGCPTN
jgi:hypothetical protein